MVSNLLSRFNCVNNPNDLTKRDKELGEKIKQSTDTVELESKFTSIINSTCDAALRVSRAGDRATKERSVPRWTSKLTILRKRALARRYQRTRNDRLRQESSGTRKGKYTIRQTSKRKNNSRKEFCTKIADSNPLNAMYKLASGKLQSKTTLSTQN